MRKVWISCLLSMVVATVAFSQELRIVKAEYGAEGSWVDVSVIVQQQIAEGNLWLQVNNQTFGDTAPGFIKHFKLVCEVDGEKKEIICQENSEISLAAKSLRAFNPVASEDVLKITKLISDAMEKGARKVVIPKAVYFLRASDGAGRHLTFQNLHDLEIDASGSTFIFESDYKGGISFEHCRNVVFKNAILTKKHPSFSQGDILSISSAGKSIDIKVHDGYPMDIREGYHSPVINFFDPKTRKLKQNVMDAYLTSIEQVAPRILRLHLKDDSDLTQVALGDMVVWRRIEGIETAVVRCSNFQYRNIVQKNSIGAAIMEVGGDGGNYYNYTLTYADPPEGASEKPLLSGSADGFMSYNVKRGPTLENCLFEGTHDDAVNISSKLLFVLENTGTSVIVSAHLFTGGSGNEIGFYDSRFSLADRAKLVSVEPLEHYNEPVEPYQHGSFAYSKPGQNQVLKLNFDRKITAEPGTYAVDFDQCSNGFVIRNSTFRDKRGRGCLVRGSGIIENCLFENILMGGINSIPEVFSFSEGPYAEGLVLRNNVFRNVNHATIQSWAGVVNVSHWAGTYWGLPRKEGGHRNIAIIGNRFEDNDGPQIIVTTAADVQITGNVFVNPMMAPSRNTTEKALDYHVLIWAAHTAGLDIADNIVMNPGNSMKKTVGLGPEVTGRGFTDGVQRKTKPEE